MITDSRNICCIIQSVPNGPKWTKNCLREPVISQVALHPAIRDPGCSLLKAYGQKDTNRQTERQTCKKPIERERQDDDIRAVILSTKTNH